MATTKNSLQIAAQADLVFLTADMLRPPNPSQMTEGTAWWLTGLSDYLNLIPVAISSDSLGSPIDGFEQLDTRQFPKLEDALSEVYRLACSTNLEAWHDEYWRLFDGAQACPLNQASYVRRDKGAILGDLAGFYAAFGWKSNPANAERPDHLVTQIDFLGMLLTMCAQASNDQQEEVVKAALADFAKIHMHDWLPSVCLQMVEATQLAYFGAVSQWIMALWIRLTLENGWPTDCLEQTIHKPNLEPDEPYECGAPELVNISLQ